MNLGENIYRLRTERNLSQGDFADALEVSRQSVSKWENNSAVPELEKLMKMAELFGITLDELVSGDPRITDDPLCKDEQQIIHIEKASSKAISIPQILGIVLYCFTAAFILLSVFVPGVVDDDVAFSLVATGIFHATALVGWKNNIIFWMCISVWLLSLFLLINGSESNLLYALYCIPAVATWICTHLVQYWKNNDLHRKEHI